MKLETILYGVPSDPNETILFGIVAGEGENV